jgi:hypothetical protein
MVGEEEEQWLQTATFHHVCIIYYRVETFFCLIISEVERQAQPTRQANPHKTQGSYFGAGA